MILPLFVESRSTLYKGMKEWYLTEPGKSEQVCRGFWQLRVQVTFDCLYLCDTAGECIDWTGEHAKALQDERKNGPSAPEVPLSVWVERIYGLKDDEDFKRAVMVERRMAK